MESRSGRRRIAAEPLSQIGRRSCACSRKPRPGAWLPGALLLIMAAAVVPTPSGEEPAGRLWQDIPGIGLADNHYLTFEKP